MGFLSFLIKPIRESDISSDGFIVDLAAVFIKIYIHK